MFQPLYALAWLIYESFAARRDAQIRFLWAENAILKSHLNGRVICSPQERALLLKIGAELNHQVKDILSIVTYKTYRRWIKEQAEGRIVRRVGRKRKIRVETIQLVLRMAHENRFWGVRRIAGELIKLGCPVGKSTIHTILNHHGFHPEPGKGRKLVDRDSSWQVFLKLHLNTLVACDYFCKNIWTPFGPKTAYCLAFIYLGSRKVFVSPATYHPTQAWAKQQARNLLMWLEDHGITTTHLIRDRDAKFPLAFDAIFKSVDIRVVKTPVMAPNANAFAESWIATLKKECLQWFVCFSLKHLDFIVQTFVDYYNERRPHQSLGNRVLKFPNEPNLRLVDAGHSDQRLGLTSQPIGPIVCEQALGGLLKHYRRAA